MLFLIKLINKIIVVCFVFKNTDAPKCPYTDYDFFMYCGLQDNLRSNFRVPKKCLWDTCQNKLPVTNDLQDIMI